MVSESASDKESGVGSAFTRFGVIQARRFAWPGVGRFALCLRAILTDFVKVAAKPEGAMPLNTVKTETTIIKKRRVS